VREVSAPVLHPLHRVTEDVRRGAPVLAETELLLLKDAQNFKTVFDRYEERLPSQLRARVKGRL